MAERCFAQGEGQTNFDLTLGLSIILNIIEQVKY